jgi:methanethiol S-methyltransferase
MARVCQTLTATFPFAQQTNAHAIIVMTSTPPAHHFVRLRKLLIGALSPPPGRARVGQALIMGLVCHTIFGLAGLAMVSAMFFGMSASLGSVAWPWAALANIALIAQFPLAHSFFLTRRGNLWLARLIPGRHGQTLATTTYATIASVQLLALFALWTPSGIVWWRAEGVAFVVACFAYAASWVVLAKASFDAGAEVQSGALGWLSLLQNIRPVFPDIRQPIYVGFILTLWTVPVWTPDQLMLAISFTTYCLIAPLLKERRFAELYGERFSAYRARVPYAVPRMVRAKAENPRPETRP